MNTDDLSREAYKAVMIEAEKFDHDLTLRFGVLASQCDNEDEYLQECRCRFRNGNMIFEING